MNDPYTLSRDNVFGTIAGLLFGLLAAAASKYLGYNIDPGTAAVVMAILTPLVQAAVTHFVPVQPALVTAQTITVALPAGQNKPPGTAVGSGAAPVILPHPTAS